MVTAGLPSPKLRAPLLQPSAELLGGAQETAPMFPFRLLANEVEVVNSKLWLLAASHSEEEGPACEHSKLLINADFFLLKLLYTEFEKQR